MGSTKSTIKAKARLRQGQKVESMENTLVQHAPCFPLRISNYSTISITYV
jgi:hypothetical protein